MRRRNFTTQNNPRISTDAVTIVRKTKRKNKTKQKASIFRPRGRPFASAQESEGTHVLNFRCARQGKKVPTSNCSKDATVLKSAVVFASFLTMVFVLGKRNFIFFSCECLANWIQRLYFFNVEFDVFPSKNEGFI